MGWIASLSPLGREMKQEGDLERQRDSVERREMERESGDRKEGHKRQSQPAVQHKNRRDSDGRSAGQRSQITSEN
ncbi:hypothetical protein BDW62DRAFT_189284 [Aspergillus aurantiobrunneus]